MFKKIKPVKALYVVLALCVLMAGLGIRQAYLWFTQDQDRELNILSTNVVVHPIVYFVQDDDSEVDGKLYRDNGYYVINVSDPSAPNHITKLKIDIEYTGTTHSYMRVYIADMLFVTRENDNVTENITVLKEDLVYNVDASAWNDCRVLDSFFYYRKNSGLGKGVVTSGGASATTVPFISGVISEIAAGDSSHLYLEVRVDTVQINRIDAFWKPAYTGAPSPYDYIMAN